MSTFSLEVSAIYRSIVEHPESDEFRYAFADAIETTDPDWAKFIRRSLSQSSYGYANLQIPEGLLDRLRVPFASFGRVGLDMRRGFVETVGVDPHLFIEHGAQLLQLAPITQVHFQRPPERRRDKFPMRELAASPNLRAVRSVEFNGSEYFTPELIRQFFESPNLDSLISFLAPGDDRSSADSLFPRSGRTLAESEEEERELWEFLFAKPAFRRLMRPGLGLTRLTFGDSVTITDEYHGAKWENLTYHPMPPEHRALEQKYGYIPMLHVGNWDATVLDVMRGKKPDFPVGARPTEEMYAVPPPLRRSAWDQSEYQ